MGCLGAINGHVRGLVVLVMFFLRPSNAHIEPQTRYGVMYSAVPFLKWQTRIFPICFGKFGSISHTRLQSQLTRMHCEGHVYNRHHDLCHSALLSPVGGNGTGSCGNKINIGSVCHPTAANGEPDALTML